MFIWFNGNIYLTKMCTNVNTYCLCTQMSQAEMMSVVSQHYNSTYRQVDSALKQYIQTGRFSTTTVHIDRQIQHYSSTYRPVDSALQQYIYACRFSTTTVHIDKQIQHYYSTYRQVDSALQQYIQTGRFSTNTAGCTVIIFNFPFEKSRFHSSILLVFSFSLHIIT